MRIIDALHSFSLKTDTVLTSGTYDGVHLGHLDVIQQIKSLAESKGLPSVILTYWPHPRIVLDTQNHGVTLLSDFDEKAELIESQGIDYLVKIPFTKDLLNMSAHQFVSDILKKTFNTKFFVIGHDHHFGKNREGNFDWLCRHATQYGIIIKEIKRRDAGDITISSSRIRELIQMGDIGKANLYLGRSYTLRGTVVKGQQIGQTIGSPTANLKLVNPHKLIPAKGVYAVQVIYQETCYDAVCNIGTRPTLNGKEKTIEVHLLDFNADLYFQTIIIAFKAFIRKEESFESIDLLKKQIKKDIICATDLLKKNSEKE